VVAVSLVFSLYLVDHVQSFGEAKGVCNSPTHLKGILGAVALFLLVSYFMC